MPFSRRAALFGAAALGTASLVGCSDKTTGEPERTARPIRIAYQKYGTFTELETWLQNVKATFEAEQAPATLELVPIEASDTDYVTKLALMNSSPDTAPDVMYEDTFMLRSDVAAGYLAPLDDHLESWRDWREFIDSAKAAGVADDGKTYGVPIGTDTRGIWYNKQLLAKAGVTGDWQPANWAELLDVARQVKSRVDGVIPLNLYSGRPQGEGAVMQGFQMLLYGTEGGTLYDDEQHKWVVGAPQFRDSLDFVKTLFADGLGPTTQQALDPNFTPQVESELFPRGKLAMGIDGSWMPAIWSEVWPEWESVMGWCGMPTQYGHSPRLTSMSGGWTLAMSSHCPHPELAFNAIAIALNYENSLENYLRNSYISVRRDCADDAKYQEANPSVEFFTQLVETTHFRPATADYPKISQAIALAMEEVMLGKSVAEAAASYDKAVENQVGADNIVRVS